MKLSARSLALLAGFSLVAALPARAQFVELVTEAPVTLQVTLTTTITTETATERKTVTVPTRLTQADIITELHSAGIITTPTTQGWSLVAVRPAPADLFHIDGSFRIYAVNGNTRILVPDDKFESPNRFEGIPYGSVFRYTEKHLGQYVLSSKGTTTTHVAYNYRPTFIASNVRFSLLESTTDGFASINYQSKDAADGFEVFFYALSSLRGSTRGSFIAETQIGDGPLVPGQGLIAITVNVGAAKLVPASLYPEVNYFPTQN